MRMLPRVRHDELLPVESPLDSPPDASPASLPASPLDKRRRAFIVGLPLAGAALALSPVARAASRVDLRAVATWTTSPVSAAPAVSNRVANQTIRNIVHTTVGGEAVRVKLSNRYGTAPLVISGASIGRGNGGANGAGGSGGALTFGGRSTFTIPAFGELVSDWLTFPVPEDSDLTVDIFIAADTSAGTSPLTIHNARPRDQILSYLGAGDQRGVATFPADAGRAFWYFISAVDVSNPQVAGTVVCLGDSITDGTASNYYANQRWPDLLARRILYGGQIGPMAIANEGIGGNRVLGGGVGDSALARFDRDVLGQSNASHVIVLEGINDISGGFTAEQIIQGHRQLIRRAHAKRLRIYGGTLTPYAAAPQPREDQRQAVNRWIRTSGEYDAVIDFELAVRDPANPRQMLSRYDSGDTLHPNSLGYAAMANAVDLELLRGYRIPL